jgi:hypothetical protein
VTVTVIQPSTPRKLTPVVNYGQLNSLYRPKIGSTPVSSEGLRDPQRAAPSVTANVWAARKTTILVGPRKIGFDPVF